MQIYILCIFSTSIHAFTKDNFYDPLSFVKAYGIPNRMIGEAYKMFAEEEGYDAPDLMMENY